MTIGRKGTLLTNGNGFGQTTGRPWNGRTSLEVVIPELKSVARLILVQSICFSLAASVLLLSIMILILSHGFERSEIGVIIFAGIVLLGLLGVVIAAELKINKLAPVADSAFNEAIDKGLHMRTIDAVSIAYKRTGYVHLTDGGINISMWEVFYFSDRTDTISLEKFSMVAYNKYLEDGTIKVAS